MGLLSFFLTSFSAYANCCFVFPHNYNGQTNTNNPPTAGDYNIRNPIFIPRDNGNYNSSSTSLPISVLKQLEENEREFRNELNRTNEKYNALAEKTKKEIEEELKIKIVPEPLPLRDYTPLGKDVEKATTEQAEKELARREAELEERAKKSNADAAELMRAQASYFKLESKEKVIEKTRHNLSSSSFAEYREAVGKLTDLFEKYHELKANGKIEHLAEIKLVLDQFVDDNGIINDFKPFFKQIENIQFKTNINQIESSLKFSYYTKIIKNINNSLGVLKNSYSPISLEKAEIAIENSLKADALLAENRLDTANRYSNRASTSINFINNLSTNIYARASRNTLSKDYFNISAVNGNTYENYSIIDASNRLAKKLKTHYSDEAVLYGNLKLQEAEYYAANGDYRKFESNLDSVWQLYDALNSTGKGVAAVVKN